MLNEAPDEVAVTPQLMNRELRDDMGLVSLSEPEHARGGADLAADMRQLPEVNMLLNRLDLGKLAAENLRVLSGRNDNWAGQTESGHSVFVKRIDGSTTNAMSRLRRVIAFEENNPGIRAPRCFGWDESSRLLVFELIVDARPGNDLAADEAFDEALAYRMGSVIGRLHNARPQPGKLDESPPDLPPIAWLHALPEAAFTASSAACLEVWRLLQADDELVAALTELRAQERCAPRVPAHCDLRLDQFLLTPLDLYVTDWEEFRLADPARDIGSFVGEWLYRALTAIPSRARSESGSEKALTHQQVISAGAREIQRRRPLVAAFWSGYRRRRGAIAPALAERSTMFAGWHVLDRVLTMAERSVRLRAVDKAAFGVGRRVLLNAAAAATTLGLGERE